MKFTVLGAGGFIGRNLVTHLRELGHEVHAPMRQERVFAGALGHVIYCIGLTSDFRQRPFDTVRAHVSVLADVLEKADFTSLLYLSSTRVYAHAPGTDEATALPTRPLEASDLYNLSKLTGESLCLHSGRTGTRIVRLSNVVGFDPHSDNFLSALIREALDGAIMLRSAPSSSKDYIDLDDVLAVLPRIAAEGVDRVYNVASGRNIPTSHVIEQLQSLTGCRVEVAAAAPSQSFLPIHITRVRREFAFSPTPPLRLLPDLVAAYRQVR
jgi:nucleoside-diphosphate-sugar epimerase